MSFLMGLNDSFSQVRGQLLLMDPLPPINKVFSLISQEEQQRKIGLNSISNSNLTNIMAFAVKNDTTLRVQSNSIHSNYGNYGRGQSNSGRGQAKVEDSLRGDLFAHTVITMAIP